MQEETIAATKLRSHNQQTRRKDKKWNPQLQQLEQQPPPQSSKYHGPGIECTNIRRRVPCHICPRRCPCRHLQILLLLLLRLLHLPNRRMALYRPYLHYQKLFRPHHHHRRLLCNIPQPNLQLHKRSRDRSTTKHSTTRRKRW